MLHPSNVLLANFAATWFMTGLIWFIQIAHYPQLAFVGREQFAVYHARHSRLTTWVVGLPMLTEAATTVALLFSHPSSVPIWIFGIGAGLLVLIWISTAVLQVPQHNILATGWSERPAQLLCATNWIRTLAWTTRAVLMLIALSQLL